MVEYEICDRCKNCIIPNNPHYYYIDRGFFSIPEQIMSCSVYKEVKIELEKDLRINSGVADK